MRGIPRLSKAGWLRSSRGGCQRPRSGPSRCGEASDKPVRCAEIQLINRPVCGFKERAHFLDAAATPP
jgi:hypothetical protein